MRTAYSALACAVYLMQDLNEARKKKKVHTEENLFRCDDWIAQSQLVVASVS